MGHARPDDIRIRELVKRGGGGGFEEVIPCHQLDTEGEARLAMYTFQ